MKWKSRRNQTRNEADRVRRRLSSEKLESRQLLAADPINVGLVYLETDYLETDQDSGGDSRGDRFILSFNGGAPDTELTEVRIVTDKDGDGISVGDPIFDTEPGGRGKDGSHGFQVLRVLTTEGRQVDAVAEVQDGGQELVLRLSNFRAGDRLEFSLDVDEVLRNAIDLAIFNDRLDVITSGQEFQDSILRATFEAPHYEISQTDSVFLNDYGDPAQSRGLNLPPDDSADIDSRPNRSAAAIGSTNQVPKPISISGHVWLDNDLDLAREPGESPLRGVELSLFQRHEVTGRLFDTGHRATTDANGYYEFPRSLELKPGEYRVSQSQPPGLFSVGAVPGSVDGLSVGFADTVDSISGINIPLGDQDSVNNDFAEAMPANIGGFVYRDDSNDGIRDKGEPGIAGVTVRLVPIDTIAPQFDLTTTTDSLGRYLFQGIAPGRYEIIEVNQPAGFSDGLDSAGRINDVVVGAAENPGDRIRDINLAGNDLGIEYNFGELALGSLSGFVYLVRPGEDCFGVHDPQDHIVLPGTRVQLQSVDGVVISETTTDANGQYLFDDLPLGDYQIVEFTPDGLLDGASRAGDIDGIQVGQAINGGLIQSISLTPGGVGTQYNFCEIAPANISGFVYHDRSNDGQRDNDEEGIQGTVVMLQDNQGQVVATTTTDVNGRYEFADIVPGNYTLVEIQPQGYLDGIDSIGLIDGDLVGRLGSDNDSIRAIEIKQGQFGTEYNFGELVAASIAGSVHADLDGDCVRDPGEVSLAGVTIRLLDALGNEIAQTQTDQDGNYRFEGLEPGDYTVVEEQPQGYFDGGATVGSEGGAVDGPNRISDISLTSGAVGLAYNFCEIPPSSLSGIVHVDRDGDCIQDPDEASLEGVTIRLLNSSGDEIATTQTDAQGHYQFDGLEPGEYTVVEEQPDGYFDGGAVAGDAGGLVENPNRISQINLGPGSVALAYNFCEIPPSTLSGFVHVDDDGDCVRDPGEISLEGVTIRLLNALGEEVARTQTDINGQYQFDGLEPGEYTVVEEQPDGYFDGGAVAGDAGGSVENPNRISQINLGPGSVALAYNFCELAPSSISGFVHVDDDGDCQYDPTEQPIAGVVIELRNDSNAVVATTTTDSQGRYEFRGLEPGDYRIFEQQPDGYFQGGEALGSGGGTVLGDDLLGLTLTAGVDLTNYNFCELAPASITGTVWADLDLDRQFDPGDQPIPGVLVELVDTQDNVIAQTQTNSQGQYRFDDLMPGVYSVRETQPAGYFDGADLVGSVGGQNLENDLISQIELGSGVDATGYDFIEVPPAEISGFVFQDGDPIISEDAPRPQDLRQFRDGQLTGDDTPISGVRIELRNVFGDPFLGQDALPGTYDSGPIQVTTDESGFYRFTGLRPGSYHVYQVQPDGFIDGLDTAGSTGGVAINPADSQDEATEIIIQQLSANQSTDPGDDAILNVSLLGMQSSRGNNFSEIIIEPPEELPPTDILPDPDPDPEIVRDPLIETFNPQIRVATFASTRDPRSPFVAIDEWAVSWHLSVINGGFPRGILGNGIVQKASTRANIAWMNEAYDTGRWQQYDAEGNLIDSSFSFDLGGDKSIPLAGDFDGDGVDEIAIYQDGHWLVDLNGNGRWDRGDLWLQLGTFMDRPVVGDWDGDGKDDIGIFGRQWQHDPEKIKRDPGLPDPANERRRRMDPDQLIAWQEDLKEDHRRFLKRGDDGTLRADAVDHVFQYGDQVDTPVTGDWNGDGIDQIGVFRSGSWLLDIDGDGRWTDKDQKKDFGRPGDQPIVGDFNGDGIDEIGVVRGDTWIIDSDGDGRFTGNDQQIQIPRTNEDSQPVVGDWDGNGKDDPGMYDDKAA